MPTPSDKQLMIVATGYYPDVADYLFSPDWQRDQPGFIIDRQGNIHGGQGSTHVIALENVGEVVKRNGHWVIASHPEVTPSFHLVPYEYCKCRKVYEMISDHQLKSLQRLLKSLLSQHGIKFPYDNQLGRVCPRAQQGKSGIYFASSYTDERQDIHAQVELVMFIKGLSS